MDNRELQEIKARAEIVCDRSVESLHTQLRELHARNAAEGCLRSGATIRESARIARGVIQDHFQELENFVRTRPDGVTGSDATIIDSVSSSTAKFLSAMQDALTKTAALAGNASLAAHIQPEIDQELISSQEAFRSNLRAFWARNRQQHGPAGITLSTAIEIVLFVLCCAFVVLRLLRPSGPYEAWAALFGLGGAGMELYRRAARRSAL